MMEHIKNYVGTITEDIKYYDNAVTYKKSLESTLWGLEQQAQYPENSSKVDQDDLTEEINRCRVKILSVSKLLKDQENKILDYIKLFPISSSKCSCSTKCDDCSEKE